MLEVLRVYDMALTSLDKRIMLFMSSQFGQFYNFQIKFSSSFLACHNVAGDLPRPSMIHIRKIS